MSHGHRRSGPASRARVADPTACTTALTFALASRHTHDRPQYVLGMGVTYVFAGIPVAHRDAAAGWYERLIGRPPDLVPNDDEAAWRLTETGWIYIVVDAGRAGSALNTLLVDDLDAFLAGLAERGIMTSPVETIGGGARRNGVPTPPILASYQLPNAILAGLSRL